jgi:Zn-dependent M28 family amino/carboxypeptidase
MKSKNSPTFDGDRAFRHLCHQVEMGARAPGTPAHGKALHYYAGVLRKLGLACRRQDFGVDVLGRHMRLTNLVAHVPGTDPNAPTTLIATHYDTRLVADRDPDPMLREQPIPGANDGGSGTAVLLEMARVLYDHPPAGHVLLGFLDGEDLGEIGGLPYATGSERLAASSVPFTPHQVVNIDMIGGEGLKLQTDRRAMAHPPSRRMTEQIFSWGRTLGYAPYTGGTQRSIISDHRPWLARGIPATLLIDLEYPYWHTHGDTPSACAATSLEAVGQVLLDLLIDGMLDHRRAVHTCEKC